MAWPIIAAAGASVLGNVLGAQESARSNKKIADKNIALQREFAQHGIRWKMEDAKAAGIHPLAALGAQTSSFSPVYTGDQSMGSAMSNIGQDISRAISTTQTAPEKEASQLQIASLKADVEGKTLDNQIRLTQLKKLQTGPAFPGAENFIPGQGDSGTVKVKPSERTASQPGRLAQESGWRPDVSYARTDTGLTPVIPESLSESMEDDLIGKILWRVRNQMVPNFTGQGKPPKSQLPKGYSDWDYSGTKQEWQPVRSKGSYPWKRWSDYVTRWQD